MATFYAVTAIKYGEMDPDSGKYVEKNFEEGEQVKGLPPKVMEELWNNGALKAVEGTGDDKKEVTVDTSTSAGTAASPGTSPPPMPGASAGSQTSSRTGAKSAEAK